MLRGILFIISAPSGAGKTTLVKGLVETLRGIEVSVSYTTRPKRKDEVDDKDYHFIDTHQFEQMIAAGEFIEHANVFGHFYGTSKKFVDSKLVQGCDIILEIDWQGAKQARTAFDNSVSIFILPPSRHTLEQRLRQRDSDSDEAIARRLSKATQEMMHSTEYDYLVINDDFKQALNDLSAIILAQRLKRSRQAKKYAALLRELLAE